jgi:hypothetical protein
VAVLPGSVLHVRWLRLGWDPSRLVSVTTFRRHLHQHSLQNKGTSIRQKTVRLSDSSSCQI